jgi:O-antigen/teichoic acid export membrane protein
MSACLNYLLAVDGPSSISRERALRNAVATGILARGGGIAVQLLAIPFAIRQLGLDAFGQYAAAVALFSWAGIVEGLFGQSVIRKLIVAVQGRDADAVSSIAFTAAVLMVGGTLIVIGGLAAVIVAVSLGSDKGFLGQDSNLLLAAALVASLRVMLAIASKIRAAFQQLHIENLLTAGASLVAAILIFACLSYKPSPMALLLSISVPALLAQLVSAWLLRASGALLQGTMCFDLQTARELLVEGGWFTLGQVGLLMERQLPVVLLSVWGLAELSGKYAVAVQIIMMATAPLLMLTIPFMPAVADAIAAGHDSWWRKRLVLIHALTVLLGLLGVAVAAVFGPQLLNLVFGQGEFLSHSACVALAAWIAVIFAANGYYAVMCAAGKIRLVGVSMFVDGICFVMLGYVAFVLFGFAGVFALGAVTTACCMYLPWRVASLRLSKT